MAGNPSARRLVSRPDPIPSPSRALPHDESLPAEAERMQSNPVSADLGQIRAGSSMARMGANALERQPRPLRELVQELRTEFGWSQKEMAIRGGCPESDFSDGLSGRKRLDPEWLIAQGPDFMRRLIRKMEAEYGLTSESEDEIEAAWIGELLTLIMRRAFRARARVGAA